ncbi:isoaspartyl peptidase/L-asparaginase-like isoform X2 [Anneissia japonica]|uniref:isoaspartyl peptidase/L-asparaginase-like isoform X2 n=1 Tax=Anneissia japonica TaxID=1529436 RepID=UPI00142571D3|nr:isoaspartyl peptidase/L-asparaginase-like isoform X2 [Anneissia japonica]
MDALIMDGRGLQTGAVTCVQNIKNPVSLARLVMEKTDHTLLAGKGANRFAEEQGVQQVSKEQLICKTAIEKLEKYKKYSLAVSDLFREGKGHDTVGAVAVDSLGNVASATSTGGITGKEAGRVGDCPLVGCGGYCDNNVGSVSSTGHGLIPQEAAEKALSIMTQRVHGSGGVIVISNIGEIRIAFATERMSWASMQNDQVCYGLDPGEKKVATSNVF